MLFTKKSLFTTVAITGALILYFLFIHALGAVDHFYLSFFNAVIMTAGLFIVIRQSRNESGSRFTYMRGFITSLASGIVASILFTFFMGYYMFELNPDIVIMLNDKLSLAAGTTKGPLLLFVLLSGISTAIVVSLILMPIFKPTWNTKEVRDKQKTIKSYSS